MEPDRLRDLIAASSAPLILDVRTRREFRQGHVPGAVNIPLWKVISSPIPAASDAPIVIYCGHGPRAAMARAVLRRRGFTRVACLTGHMTGWRGAGLPVEKGGYDPAVCGLPGCRPTRPRSKPG